MVRVKLRALPLRHDLSAHHYRHPPLNGRLLLHRPRTLPSSRRLEPRARQAPRSWSTIEAATSGRYGRPASHAVSPSRRRACGRPCLPATDGATGSDPVRARRGQHVVPNVEMGHPKATLLLKHTPAPQRPPPDVPLEAWGHEHVCYNGLKGKARWFKVCDLVYTSSSWPGRTSRRG